MRILSISLDRNLFNENSEVRQRIIEYGSLVEELHIVVFTKRDANNANNMRMTRIANSVFLYPTNSRSKWLYIFDALKIGKKIFENWKLEIENSRDWLVTSQDPFECGLVGYRMAKQFGLPLQLQIHTDFLSPYFKKESLLNRLRVLIARFLIPRANGIRVVSERIRKSLVTCHLSHVAKIDVLPIFVDVEAIRQAPIRTNLHQKYPRFDFIILMASRLTKEKNIGLAIEVIREIRDANIRIHANDTNIGLIIVGLGPEEQNLKFKIKNLKLHNNIVLENWTDDLISYYKTADLFLLTSNYEGYGRTVIEAMASGCSVVMTDVGCAGEIVKNEENGLVVPVGDKKKLEEAIIKMICDRSNLAISAEQAAAKLTSKEKYLEEYNKSWEACFLNKRNYIYYVK